MSVIEMRKPKRADDDPLVVEDLALLTGTTAASRAADAKVAELERIAAEAGSDRTAFLRALRDLPAARAEALDRELARVEAKQRYEAERDRAVAERVPLVVERMKAALRDLDVALEAARAANDEVVRAWTEAEQVLGSSQKVVPSDLRWMELVPESANSASRLDTWRSYCRRYGWL